MSDSISPLPSRPSLSQLKKRAKELLQQLHAGENSALQRLKLASPARIEDEITLADAQFVIAREHGFESWAKCKRYIEELPPPQKEQYEQLARALARAHMEANPALVRQLNHDFSTAFVADFHHPGEMQPRLVSWFASASRDPDLALADARQMVAHAHEFKSWDTFVESLKQRLPFYRIAGRENKLDTQGPKSEKDWEIIFDVMRERGVTKLKADGITNAAMKRLSQMDQVLEFSTHSDVLTDEGLSYLANMPRLIHLEIGGSQITDRGLEALRHLTNLQRFQSCWTKGISDTGAAHLAGCDRLESVNLMGTATGDGLIKTLAGKQNLHHLKTGRNVTDAGIELLHQIPAFKTWRGGKISCRLLSAEAEPNHLLIDGPFTDAGLAQLAHLDGLCGLSFFWHSPSFTAKGLKALGDLPHLGFLGCEGQHCDDDAMSRIAALPHLQMLMAQAAVASDKGWRALSKSRSLQYIWGRDCPNFTNLGFAALGEMPALRGIAISCKNVEDAALANLPNFPALREIVAMDIPDAGFRHLGRCHNLEALWCMYCRDTTDAATLHIGQLPRLETYYAGMTRITDRTLEILSAMNSLKRLEFCACQAITNTGVAKLAALPHLRELTINGSPAVTPAIEALFSATTKVTHST